MTKKGTQTPIAQRKNRDLSKHDRQKSRWEPVKNELADRTIVLPPGVRT